jgi:hypothetical protein
VYNQSWGLVDETSDVEFDETNGSQEEEEILDDVGNERLRIAIKNMTIGDVNRKMMMMIHLLYFKYCHLPLVLVIKIKLVM